jgi:hypothetical protein
MKKTRKTTTAPRKLGVKAHDNAAKPRRLDHNFGQSRDIHEDRGAIQSHLGRRENLRAARGQKKTS